MSVEALAIVFDYHNNHIYSCSWGPSDNGQAMDSPPKIVADAFVDGIVHGRNGKGSLFVFASGNGGSRDDNWYPFFFTIVISMDIPIRSLLLLLELSINTTSIHLIVRNALHNWQSRIPLALVATS
jgi:hypothetical protein